MESWYFFNQLYNFQTPFVSVTPSSQLRGKVQMSASQHLERTRSLYLGSPSHEVLHDSMLTWILLVKYLIIVKPALKGQLASVYRSLVH